MHTEQSTEAKKEQEQVANKTQVAQRTCPQRWRAAAVQSCGCQSRAAAPAARCRPAPSSGPAHRAESRISAQIDTAAARVGKLIWLPLRVQGRVAGWPPIDACLRHHNRVLVFFMLPASQLAKQKQMHMSVHTMRYISPGAPQTSPRAPRPQRQPARRRAWPPPAESSCSATEVGWKQPWVDEAME